MFRWHGIICLHLLFHGNHDYGTQNKAKHRLHRPYGYKIGMVTSGMVQIDAGIDGTVAEVLQPRSSGPSMVRGRMTTTIAMHYA